MEDKVIGTNYYATELPTEGQIAKMQTLLMKRQLQQVQKMLEEVPRYHIGKQSGGWQFLFAPHIRKRGNCRQIVSPWEDTLESITNYLSKEGVKIEDEYGKSYTCKQFFNKISVYNDPENAINGEQYNQKYPKYPNELSCEKYEYITDEGLRFSTDEDFS